MHAVSVSHRFARPWAVLVAAGIVAGVAVAASADVPPTTDCGAVTATVATAAPAAATLEPVTEARPVQMAPIPAAAPVAPAAADSAFAPLQTPEAAACAAAAGNPFATVRWERPPGYEPPPRHVDGTGALTDEGEASWYGADFAGLPTASGEIFNMYAFTVAHPSWPLGSVIRVHNLENDRSVLARVNDRGPYARGRIVDCSLAIARALDFTGQGFAMVRITLLDSLPDAWTRFTGLATPGFSDLLQARHPTRAAAVLALAEDTAPSLPLAVNAAIDTAVSERTAFRTASVLPFPAILHAWEHVSRWLLGPEGAPSRWLRIEQGLDSFGLRAMLRLFTQP